MKMRAPAVRTWNGHPSPYWQHNAPLACPKRHPMGWLGSRFWLCTHCKTIYVSPLTSMPTGGHNTRP